MSETVDLVALDDAGFERLYVERIKPCFDAHEPERLEAVATFKKHLTIGLAIAAALGAGVWVFSQAVEFALFAAMAGGFLAYAGAMIKINAVRGKVKQASCAAVAQAIGVDFTAAGFAPPAFARFRELDLLPGHDRSSFEDLFHGAYKGAGFDLYEGHLERRQRDSKGRTSWVTVFRGQAIRLTFPRNFLGVTIVRRDAGVFNVFGGGGRLERVRLEDPMFEKAFEVYGTDQVEARYLLHPALMQRLVDLEAVLRGKRLRCAFEQGEVLVAIEGGNLFEPGSMFRPLADPARARRLVEEVAGVVRVMDQVLTAQALRPKRPS